MDVSNMTKEQAEIGTRIKEILLRTPQKYRKGFLYSTLCVAVTLKIIVAGLITYLVWAFLHTLGLITAEPALWYTSLLVFLYTAGAAYFCSKRWYTLIRSCEEDGLV